MQPNTKSRFFANVLVGESCWEWLGYVRPNGYGLTSINGKNVYAHRASYEYSVGPIPPGMTIDHLCRNRKCVNPSHLEAVTMRENVLRGAGHTAINARKTHCHKGHEFSAENTRIAADGGRECRACSREKDRRYHDRKRHAREWAAKLNAEDRP